MIRRWRTRTHPFHDLDDYVAIPRRPACGCRPTAAGWRRRSRRSARTRRSTSPASGGSTPGRPAAAHPVGRRRGQPAVPARRHAAVRLQATRPRRGRGGRQRAAEAALWRLPASGGEASLVTGLPGGVAGAEVAAGRGHRAIACCPAGPAGRRAEDEEAAAGAQGRRGLRDLARDAAGPLLGPRPRPGRAAAVRRRRGGPCGLAGQRGGRRGGRRKRRSSAAVPGGAGAVAGPRDLTPEPGRALSEQAAALTPGRHHGRHRLVAVGPAGRRTRNWSPSTSPAASAGRDLSAPEFDYGEPGVRPRRADRLPARGAWDRRTARRQHPGRARRLSAGRRSGTDLLPGFDRWPSEPSWCRAGTVSTSPPMTRAAGRCSRWTSPR